MPDIRKMTVPDRRTGKRITRYEILVNLGRDPVTGRRRQTRKRYPTEREARQALARIAVESATGAYVPRKKLTVSSAVDDYIAARHNLRPTSLSKLTYDLGVLNSFYGSKALQALTKADVDRMISALRSGGTHTPGGRMRKPWGARAINKVVAATARLLEDARRQGLVPRNVAEHVDRVHTPHSEVDSFTESEVRQLLSAVEGTRMAHAWHLALSGLRRGEIAGLTWHCVDFDAGTLTIANNRVDAGGVVHDGDPKSFTSRRVLPLPASLLNALRTARDMQRRERAQARAAGHTAPVSGYVVVNEAGQPYAPQGLSRLWRAALTDAGLRHIKLHAARHTCATLMHLQGVPVAVIAAWIGHKNASLTMRLYAHSQDDALKNAAATLSATSGHTN